MKLIAIGVVVATAGAFALQEKERPISDEERTRFIFSAVIEGLAGDGFDPKLAGEIAEHSKRWFVPACPVCEPVLLAFRAYRASCESWWLKGDPWYGAKNSPETMESFRSADTKTRHEAFKGLIEKYVKSRFDRVRMSEGARDRMQESLKLGMKQGLEFLKKSGSEELFPASCPSCEGAN